MIGELWDVGGKLKNLVSGNGFKASARPEDYGRMVRNPDGSFTQEVTQADIDRERGRFTSNAFMDAAKRGMALQEQNRQIAGEAAAREAQMAQMYPELWQAKRKARFQAGALSALGGT